ncbi:hypothetical protein Btru_075061 [Bulinus truncatus]|nr:hypothetical protein Btru_075061 [Bulinus truncatus]
MLKSTVYFGLPGLMCWQSEISQELTIQVPNVQKKIIIETLVFETVFSSLTFKHGFSDMAAIKQIKQIKKKVKTEFIQQTTISHITAGLCVDTPQKECFIKGKSNVHSMATIFTKQPFVVTGSNSNTVIINQLLNFSLSKQIEEDFLDDPGFITLVIQRCFETIGIKSRIAYGERKSSCNSNFKPHVWLIIEENIVDNCFIRDLCDKTMKFIEDNIHQCYKECELDSSVLKDCTLSDTNSNLKKCLYFYLKKPDRAFALSLNREQCYNYYFAMIRFMYDYHKVSFKGIDPRVRYICWYCERYPKNGKNFITDILMDELSEDQWVESTCSSSWRFFHCKECMVANYCDKSCQNSDWNEIHSITCLPRGSVCQSPLEPDK